MVEIRTLLERQYLLVQMPVPKEGFGDYINWHPKQTHSTGATQVFAEAVIDVVAAQALANTIMDWSSPKVFDIAIHTFNQINKNGCAATCVATINYARLKRMAERERLEFDSKLRHENVLLQQLNFSNGASDTYCAKKKHSLLTRIRLYFATDGQDDSDPFPADNLHESLCHQDEVTAPAISAVIRIIIDEIGSGVFYRYPPTYHYHANEAAADVARLLEVTQGSVTMVPANFNPEALLSGLCVDKKISANYPLPDLAWLMLRILPKWRSSLPYGGRRLFANFEAVLENMTSGGNWETTPWGRLNGKASSTLIVNVMLGNVAVHKVLPPGALGAVPVPLPGPLPAVGGALPPPGIPAPGGLPGPLALPPGPPLPALPVPGPGVPLPLPPGTLPPYVPPLPGAPLQIDYPVDEDEGGLNYPAALEAAVASPDAADFIVADHEMIIGNEAPVEPIVPAPPKNDVAPKKDPRVMLCGRRVFPSYSQTLEEEDRDAFTADSGSARPSAPGFSVFRPNNVSIKPCTSKRPAVDFRDAVARLGAKDLTSSAQRNLTASVPAAWYLSEQTGAKGPKPSAACIQAYDPSLLDQAIIRWMAARGVQHGGIDAAADEFEAAVNHFRNSRLVVFRRGHTNAAADPHPKYANVHRLWGLAERLLKGGDLPTGEYSVSFQEATYIAEGPHSHEERFRAVSACIVPLYSDHLPASQVPAGRLNFDDPEYEEKADEKIREALQMKNAEANVGFSRPLENFENAVKEHPANADDTFVHVTK